ncbi:MAG TPA: hypothetical protein VNS34_08905 [Rhizobiaceae bacterium]|nr:hypothetical protein [Rhizobiaceae bacterium]
MITPARNPEPEKPEADQDTPVGPTIEEQDWEALEGGEPEPVSVPDNGDLRYAQDDEEISGELPEENDDNPYQESDAALPDDSEEEAIARNPALDDRRFHDQ